MAVALGAAHLGGTPHGGGMRGREERPDAQPVTVQGRSCSWRVATTVDVDPSLQQTRLTLEERGCGGASLINTYAGAAPPQPRGLARPARSFKRLEGSAAAADPAALGGSRGSSRRAATAHPKKRLDWRPPEADADPCEERAATEQMP